MQRDQSPKFWRIQSVEHKTLIESYCLGCSRFVCASSSNIKVLFVETLHLMRCAESPKNEIETRRMGMPRASG